MRHTMAYIQIEWRIYKDVKGKAKKKWRTKTSMIFQNKWIKRVTLLQNLDIRK